VKKALILSPFFYPEMISTGKYNTDIAQTLVEAGYKVTILCSHPLYPKWVPSLSEASLEGMKIIRGGKMIRYPSHPMLRRLILELWFTFFVFRKLLSETQNYDLVIPIFPPSLMMIAVGFFKNRFKKMVGIVHDLQAVHLSATNSGIKKILGYLITAVEKYAFSSCDSIIYLSSEMRSIASKKFKIPLASSTVLYPFVTVNEFTDKGSLNHLIDSSKNAVVYSGALGDKQNPDMLYELADKLTRERDDTIFYFFSDGPNYLKLKKQNSSSLIRFNPLVDEAAIGELLLKSDIQILPQASGTSSASLPSKLPNILASGSHLFVITDPESEVQKMLEDLRTCVISNTWVTRKNCDQLHRMLNHSLLKSVDNVTMSLFEKNRLIDIFKA
jgi:glycosyltransferase involved in cell wall biosynthesis